MKACPFCAEQIQDAAVFCRYCRKDLNASPEPKAWKYLTGILHFRNMDESGWIWARDVPNALIAQDFWNQSCPDVVASFDKIMTSSGWEVVKPRGPACIELKATRDPVSMFFGIAAALGGNDAGNPWKMWIGSITLRWRAPSDTPSEKTVNYWINPKTNQWERMEQETDGKWYILCRPADYNPDDPNDDRWDKIPC